MNIVDFIDRNRLNKITIDLINLESENPDKSNVNTSNEVLTGQYIYDFFKNLDIEVEKQFSYEKRFNVIAKILSDDKNAKTLAFNGHIDVVPAGDLSKWDSDPFCAVIKENKIYGRGACDMKASIACFMHVMELIKNNNIKLPYNILFTAVIDEEKNNKGCNTLLKNGFSADYCIVGEPTSCQVQIGHRGVLALDIDIHGISCHAAMTAEGQGRNAILDSVNVIIALEEVDQLLKKNVSPVLGASQLNVTCIQGGTKVNIIPNLVTLSVDGRIAKGESLEFVMDLVKEKLQNLKSQNKILDFSVKSTTYCPSYELAQNNEYLKHSLHLSHLANNYDDFGVFGATCEASLLNARCPNIIIYGAGNLKQAHNANEFVEIDDLYKACKFYALQVVTPC